MTEPEPAPLPAWPVDLALSGGGFRASGFHFGALRTLHAVGLTDQVQALSTVSGGTIVGAAWALSRAQGEPFAVFDERFSTFLAQCDFTNLALASLLGQTGTPSVIRAAAQVYAEQLFTLTPPGQAPRAATFGDVRGPGAPARVCFNATEFLTGVAFRFQSAPGDQAKVGNGNVWLDPDDARALRLADIVAASSCFPGGFEPLVLPDDAVGPDGRPPRLRFSVRKRPAVSYRAGAEAPTPPERIALMDGGIFDNQGIDALLLDRPGDDDRACFVISDTTNPPHEAGLYTPPVPPSPGFLTVGGALALGAGLVAVGVLGLVTQGVANLGPHPGYAAFDLLLAAVLAYAGFEAVRTLGGLRSIAMEYVDRRHYDELAQLSLNQAIFLLRLRLQSLLALTGSVFMKRVRDLTYARVHQDKRIRETVANNLIHELPRNRSAIQLLTGAGLPAPSPRLLAAIERASAMGTQLWWDDDAQREAVIFAGEGSMCFNLLDHLLTRYRAPADEPAVGELYRRLVARWAALNAS